MWFRLAFVSAKRSIIHDFDANLAPFLLIFMSNPYICVFCRNEENEMKNKKFGQELKNLYKKKAVVMTITLMVVTTRQNMKKIVQQRCSMVATIEPVCSKISVWSRSSTILGVVTTTTSVVTIVIKYTQCGRNHGCNHNPIFLQKLCSIFCVVATTSQLWS